MSKKVKVLVSVLVAVVLLTVGSAATVMAEETTPPAPEPEARGLQARVAEKLGIPSDNLTSAFKQTRQEMREKAFIRCLEKALRKERINEDDYDEIIAWWETRPEVLESLFPCSSGASALGNRHMWGGHNRGWHGMRPPKLAD